MRLCWPHLGQTTTKPRSSDSIECSAIIALLCSWGSGKFGLAMIVHNHLGRTQTFLAVTIAPLERLQNDMIRLRRVVARRNGLVIMRVKRLTDAFFGFDSVRA